MMHVPDIIAALEPVVDAMRALGVLYRIGGSVASSALGLPRTTIDVDLVCDLRPNQIVPFVAALQELYYVDEDMIREAIKREASFNLIHLETMLKIDVFLARTRPYDRIAFARSLPKSLAETGTARLFDLSSAEDTVLYKLEWYHLGGAVSERQWADVLGVLKVQGEILDLAYMKKWARELGVVDLLERALHEAGLGLPDETPA